MDEGKLGEQINAGYRAENELRMTADAFVALRGQYVEAWEKTALSDQYGRERLWQAVQILGKVESHLRTAVANGKVSEADLKRLRTGKAGIFS